MKKLILLSLSILLFIACESKSNDAAAVTLTSAEFKGTWTLTDMSFNNVKLNYNDCLKKTVLVGEDDTNLSLHFYENISTASSGGNCAGSNIPATYAIAGSKINVTLPSAVISAGFSAMEITIVSKTELSVSISGSQGGTAFNATGTFKKSDLPSKLAGTSWGLSYITFNGNRLDSNTCTQGATLTFVDQKAATIISKDYTAADTTTGTPESCTASTMNGTYTVSGTTLSSAIVVARSTAGEVEFKFVSETELDQHTTDENDNTITIRFVKK